MNLTRTAAFVAGAAALAALVAGAATSRHDIQRPVTLRRAPVDARGADLAREISRLHERLRPDAAPRQRARNLFSFNASRVAPPVAAEPRPVVAETAAAVPAPPFLLKLVGIAEDTGDGGPIRTAFISGEGQLFMAKEGDAITPRFKVTKIAADAIEITDTTDGSTHRLPLK